MREESARAHNTMRKTLAWMVHLYTAAGALLGMGALFLSAQGRTREAFLCLAAAAIVDSTDGWLARLLEVDRLLPGFSGAQLDNAVDVLTYIFAPVFIMGMERLVPHTAWLAAPLIAGMYAYGQVNMKTPDDYFLGFPSYWNIVALYLFWLRPGPVVSMLIVLIPSFLSFVPAHFLYPSKNKFLGKFCWVLGGVWSLFVIGLLMQDQPGRWLVLASLFYPLFYLAGSLYVELSMSGRVVKRQTRRT